MKIAFIIPGMLRNFEFTYPRFKKYLIDELNPDIFFSGYPNQKGLEYCQNKLIELYNPKKFILQEYTDELRKKISPNETTYNQIKRSEGTPHTWMSGIWNVYNANELRKEYEKENNFKYDLVFKTRIDFYFYSPISKDDINLALSGKLLIPNAWDFKSVNPVAVSDVFALSTPDVIDKYCELYNCIDEYTKIHNNFHPETLCGLHISNKRLDRVEIVGDVPNPFGDWGCGWATAEDPDNLYDDRKKY